MDIEIVVDSPNVGQNLRDQYGTSALAFSNNIPDNSPLIFTDLFPSLSNDGVRRMEIINSNLGNIVPSQPPVLQALPLILNPKSRGSIEIVSKNPLFYPKVNIGIFTDDPTGTDPTSDLALQIDFFNIVKTVVETSGGTMLFPSAFQYSIPGQLAQATMDANHLTLQSHIIGTTQMGQNINEGVVDGKLKVFGLKNVYIGDIGIEPNSVDGNTCFSAYYIALVLADVLGVPTPPVL